MSALKYAWLTYRRETLWFPLAFLVFFVVIAWMMRRPDIRFAIARGYLGFMLPLIGGILAAYAVLDDPALELKFAAPAGAARTLLTRLAPVLGVQAATGIAFQLFARVLAVDFSPLGGPVAVQLAWIVPAVTLAAVGMGGALATAQCATGAFLAGAVWLVQLLMKGWILSNCRMLYLFMGVLEPRHPDLRLSQVSLLAASAALGAVSWRLLRRQERYL